MIALYGTQDCYKADVLNYGIKRDSAAFFLLPDQPEQKKVRLTIACAVYHAVGLSLLQEAIQSRRSLGEILEATGGISLIYMRDVTTGDWYTCRYFLPDGETYPYVKIKDSGPLDARSKLAVQIVPCFFNMRIDGKEGEMGYRFFQKQGGREQWLPGCNMQVLERLCMNVADYSLITYSDCLFGKYAYDEDS